MESFDNYLQMWKWWDLEKKVGFNMAHSKCLYKDSGLYFGTNLSANKHHAWCELLRRKCHTIFKLIMFVLPFFVRNFLFVLIFGPSPKLTCGYQLHASFSIKFVSSTHYWNFVLIICEFLFLHDIFR